MLSSKAEEFAFSDSLHPTTLQDRMDANILRLLSDRIAFLIQKLKLIIKYRFVSLYIPKIQESILLFRIQCFTSGTIRKVVYLVRKEVAQLDRFLIRASFFCHFQYQLSFIELIHLV